MTTSRTAPHPHTTRHRRTVMRSAVLAATALTAALLGGCSGDEEPEPEPTPEPSAGPLESLFGDYLADWSNEDVTRQLNRIEESVAECMAEQGFAYTPVDYSAASVDFLGTDLGVEPGTIEFAEQYGYGLTTDPWGVDDLDPDAVEDPNAEYVAAMSQAEQDAYYTALYGPGYADQPTADDDALAEFSWEDAGCTGAAQQQLIAGEGMPDDDEFLGLQQEMVTMMETAANDPRLDSANAEWAVCMAEAGYAGLSAVGDAEAGIGAEVDAVWASAASDADPTLALRDQSAPDPVVEEQLALITPREIETAVADLTCRSQVGYEELRREVDHEYQREFLAENQAEIAEWLASLESLRGEE